MPSDASASEAARETSIEPWPALPLQDWADTQATLHMWTQIVGKTAMELTQPINHWWHITLQPTARGLATAALPYQRGFFDVEFDLIGHRLVIRTSTDERRTLELAPRSVADFYREYMATLAALGIDVAITASPDEVPAPIPFAEDDVHASYDPAAVERFRVALHQAADVFSIFRGDFIGKCSPVHFFWGAFDLAVTRFSGRLAPPQPDADLMTREGYSHECSSLGWWPGNGGFGTAAFYAYHAPAPDGFAAAVIQPDDAGWNETLSEFVLPYDAVRGAPDPEAMILEFARSAYGAGAELANWDRAALEAVESGWASSVHDAPARSTS